MFEREGNTIRGVLCDFDLASVSESPQSTERTGTLPFMAHDLLTDDGLGENIMHKYVHDVQVFFWVAFIDSRLFDLGYAKLTKFSKWFKMDAINLCAAKGSILFDYLRGFDPSHVEVQESQS